MWSLKQIRHVHANIPGIHRKSFCLILVFIMMFFLHYFFYLFIIYFSFSRSCIVFYGFSLILLFLHYLFVSFIRKTTLLHFPNISRPFVYPMEVKEVQLRSAAIVCKRTLYLCMYRCVYIYN